MKKKIKIISLIIIAVSLIGIRLSFSLYHNSSKEVKNTFIKIRDPNIIINETFDGKAKKDVNFNINSDIPLMTRVRLIFNFADDENRILSFKPIINEDYVLTINEEDWIYKEGYYYLKDHSNPESVLIKELKNLNSEYKLTVEILAQSANEFD